MTGKMITYNLLRAGTSSHILPKTSSRVLFILYDVRLRTRSPDPSRDHPQDALERYDQVPLLLHASSYYTRALLPYPQALHAQ